MTFAEFLAEWKSAHEVWAAEADPADIVAPQAEKIRQGWVAERPPHTTFNWHQRRTDQRLEELEAKAAWLESILAEIMAAAGQRG